MVQPSGRLFPPTNSPPYECSTRQSRPRGPLKASRLRTKHAHPRASCKNSTSLSVSRPRQIPKFLGIISPKNVATAEGKVTAEPTSPAVPASGMIFRSGVGQPLYVGTTRNANNCFRLVCLEGCGPCCQLSYIGADDCKSDRCSRRYCCEDLSR